ncbi:MAG: D-alanyl-D-alanine carboxypeptidase [Eubacteriales bacterium]|nr:D-alanyl-D-alanine carboxypeptidase [Eubacteriales bacterium]MDD4389862.1 D-alanyl-D-alanine carboxypeptidase [Eubacteriales bacterium]
MLNIKGWICGALAAVLVIGGFMGISQFVPEERNLNIAVISEEVSVDAAVMKARSEFPALAVDAKASLLMDSATGKVLYADNENEGLPLASVTKIMTMLLVMEAIENGQVSLEDVVTISERAASMGGSQMYMEPGEQHTLDELMKGISMVSANDACVAVGEYIGGSEEIFVENMNKRAAELGMENSNFVNTNGLPAPNHYSSAYDIALMSRELLKYTGEHPWFTTWQDTIKVGLPGKQKEFGLTNTNKLIKQYNGAIGIKTGFTQEAGYCLSAAAKRGDTTLIAVVMGCETSKGRLAEISKQLDYGFATYDTVKIAAKGEATGKLKVEKGIPESINSVASENISALVKKGERESITTEVKFNEKIKAPIKKGEIVGELIIYQNGTEIDRYPLSAEKEVKKAGILHIYKSLLTNLAQ